MAQGDNTGQDFLCSFLLNEMKNIHEHSGKNSALTLGMWTSKMLLTRGMV